jgi:creatinine deaminase
MPGGGVMPAASPSELCWSSTTASWPADTTSACKKGSAVLHAEMDCLEYAGPLTAADYRRAVLYSTLSPCDMCSGAILLYDIPKIVIGENRTFQGPEHYLRSRGVEIQVIDDEACRRLMEDFIAASPDLWNEGIGEP